MNSLQLIKKRVTHYEINLEQSKLLYSIMCFCFAGQSLGIIKDFIKMTKLMERQRTCYISLQNCLASIYLLPKGNILVSLIM